ncbi:UMP kinase [Rickettsiella grylli]|uniref:UMP kinase n=1 Tax=Rickettsiella grylli TaxID=59196 RepID=UPI0008FD35C2|nr:UMP kinase [Rickettsiella grylli]OJA00230.1 UMP kinase [Rickettsiella grylli]
MASSLKYRRVLLKLSGEALCGNASKMLDPVELDRIVSDIVAASDLGVQIAIVIGGGNIFRGETLAQTGIDRITGDQMGMLGTIINALALRDTFDKHKKIAKIMSAIPITGFVPCFDRYKAIRYLEKGYIVIFAGGTGNPLVSTDSAASLRGIEMSAELLLKATHVDGVYSADPNKEAKARLYSSISYEKALEQELGIMDLTAFMQCRDHDLPLLVFNIKCKNALLDILQGKRKGTLVTKRNER